MKQTCPYISPCDRFPQRTRRTTVRAGHTTSTLANRFEKRAYDNTAMCVRDFRFLFYISSYIYTVGRILIVHKRRWPIPFVHNTPATQLNSHLSVFTRLLSIWNGYMSTEYSVSHGQDLTICLHHRCPIPPIRSTFADSRGGAVDQNESGQCCGHGFPTLFTCPLVFPRIFDPQTECLRFRRLDPLRPASGIPLSLHGEERWRE